MTAGGGQVGAHTLLAATGVYTPRAPPGRTLNGNID